MHFHKHFAPCILSGALAVAVPFCLAQTQKTQPAQLPQQQQQTKPSQAAAHPSHSMMSANQRAADLLNTINKTEIDSGQAIQGHVDNANIKTFAQTLVTDHLNLQTQLESAASQAKINLSEDAPMMKQSQRWQKRMDKEKPAQAGHAYLANQVRDHASAIRRLQHLEPQITDPQLKTVVQNAIPLLKKHEAEARKLQSELKTGGTGGSSH